MSDDFLLQTLAVVLANGLVTFGVVKTTLRFLEKEIGEVRAIASRAHRRIDDLILNLNQRRSA